MWIDIAGIIFVCVTANHLGLIGTIEEIIGKRIPIINCPKCSSFWFSVIYGVGQMGFSFSHLIPLLAISFLASYSAIWVELLEGFIDILNDKLYEKIYPTTDNGDTSSADPDDGDSEGKVSKLRQNYKISN